MRQMEAIRHAADVIREKAGRIQAGTLGLVLGSGLGDVAEAMEDARDLPYADIPGWPGATVAGHPGFLRAGTLSGRPVLALCGRAHLYEGASPAEVCLPVRVLGLLGIATLVLTNAAGALNPAFAAEELMLVTDHINLSGQNPLTGPNLDELGPRFPDMSRAWDRGLAALALRCAAQVDIPLRSGVYIQIPGPSLETPAETRAFRRLGADAIGMSTVIEAIAARHMGLRLLGLSCLTNKNDPDDMAEISHAEVLAAAKRSSRQMASLLRALAARPELDAAAAAGLDSETGAA